ncbi:MAG: IclR family transcriptional regulator [Synergistaceae bacterium]|nr:IclR family transcriptional regulator [Synergistaceae bacterium]MBR1604222.1 IclR family transcriptional regulator [Synergistaceae bacterium]
MAGFDSESRLEQKISDGIKSLGKALDILTCVGETYEGVSVTEVSDKLNINKATVSKMLSTMASRNFVRKDIHTRRYRLGYRLIELGSKLIEATDIRTEAYPYLKALEKQVNEVINLAVYDNGEIIYVDKFEGSRPLRLHSSVGGRADLTCTSVGKVLMAFLPEQDQAYLKDTHKKIEQRTAKSIKTWQEFARQCAKVREQGYALDIEESSEGIMCVGAPVFDYSGNIAGAVSISCPTVRCSIEHLIELKDILIETCGKISAECGYRV